MAVVDEFPKTKDLSAEESVDFITQKVDSLDGMEKMAGDAILSFVDGKLIEVSAEKLKASEARYLLEIHVYSAPQTRTVRTIRTILWLNGETIGPGGDQLVHECPEQTCSYLFEPPVGSFLDSEVWEYQPERDERGQFTGKRKKVLLPLVYCPMCNRRYLQRDLTDSRWCHGTWDILGKHMARRFARVRFDADIMKRIIDGDPQGKVDDVLNKTPQAVDRYLEEQTRLQKIAYYLRDDFVRDSAGGMPDNHFKAFLKA